MDRVIGIYHESGRIRDDAGRAARLRHRRAAEERCVRAGLLRRCTPGEPGAAGDCRTT